MVANGEPTRYPVWAHRKETAGGEGINEEQDITTDTITLTVWYHRALADIKPVEWWAEDENGAELDIVSVVETAGGRNWQLAIKCVRRE